MKNQMWIVGLLLSGVMSPIFAEQQMAGMMMQENTAQAIHQGKGKVVAVDSAKLSIKLAHEPIKSLGWPGMTMSFSVAKASLLDGLKTGDAVQFELSQPGSKKWEIVRIERR